jgi:hypothetical protein
VKARAALASAGLVAALTLVSGCSASDGSEPEGAKPFDAMAPDEHLACAVDISAYTYLIAAGTLPEDRELAGQSALALAWHHNAYAIPQGLSDQADLINRKRTALMGADQPKAIAARAAACIAAAMAKHGAE